MAKFLFVSALAFLCLGMTMAGDASMNPQAQFMSFINKISNMDFAKTCWSACGGWCKYMDVTCDDESKDCEDANASCGTACQNFCGCFDACHADCDAQESCEGLEGVEAEGCKMRVGNCKDECGALCPIDLGPKYMDESMASLRPYEAQLLQYIIDDMEALEDRP